MRISSKQIRKASMERHHQLMEEGKAYSPFKDSQEYHNSVAGDLTEDRRIIDMMEKEELNEVFTEMKVCPTSGAVCEEYKDCIKKSFCHLK